MLARTAQLVELLDGTPGLRGAEIGVYRADLSVELLQAIPDLLLILVDGWMPYDGIDWTSQQPAEFFATVKQEALNRLRPVRNRCVVIDQPSPAAAMLVPDRSLDFVFIDGNHTYQAVKEDLFAWAPKVHPTGGVLAGHDYVRADGSEEVKRAVDEYAMANRLTVETGADSVWWMWDG